MKSEEVRGKRKMQIYVDGNAVRSGNGQKEYPFQTISEAAKIARPGYEVLVAPGVYREYVDPANAGCEDARIVYRSVEPGKAVITGAEIVDNWEHLEGDVWTARVSNGLFGDYNPNCGKTSLFNIASGAHEHVGNYSGVTVDAKEGIFEYGGYRFTDIRL